MVDWPEQDLVDHLLLEVLRVDRTKPGYIHVEILRHEDGRALELVYAIEPGGG